MDDSQISQIMKTARELIQAGKFAEAREALRPIENVPAAQEWIAKLDERLADKAEALAETEAKAKAEADSVAQAATRAAAKAKAEAESRAKAAVRAAEETLRPSGDKPFRPGVQAPAALGSVVKAMSGQGIEPRLAATALGLAAVTGLAAALLDGLLGMPGDFLPFALGWGVALLGGPAYAMMRQRVDRGAIIIAAVAGAVTLLFWFLMSQITVGDVKGGDPRDMHNFWFDEYITLLNAVWSGAILGLIGLGWYALLPRVPEIGERVLKMSSDRMKRGG